MIILKPLSKERIWGTSKLHSYSGDKEVEKIGSVYSVSAIENLSNQIIYGDNHNDLYSAIKADPKKFGLEKNIDYPIIISFTAADENLSIQVHPTDNYALKYENKAIGKSESWYFIEEPNDKWIYADSLLEDKSLIKDLIISGDFDKVVDKRIINKDDLVFIESGTLHALTAGSLVYEIQQSTDITYRFYDYGRIDTNGEPRELHLDQAIDTLNVENKVKVTSFNSDESIDELPYKLYKTNSVEDYRNEENIAVALTVIKGNVIIDDYHLTQGMSCLVLPSEEVEIKYESESEIIIATPNIYF